MLIGSFGATLDIPDRALPFGQGIACIVSRPLAHFLFAVVITITGFAATAGSSLAHELITPETADRYITQAGRFSGVMKSRDSASVRADAALSLAKMLDEIRELLNRDIASHGRIQGLPSQLLVDRLKQTGHALVWIEPLGRFGAPVELYKTALDLDPKSKRSHEALAGFLFGSFYDSFRDDPLKPINAEGTSLHSLIETGERLARDYPREAFVEEARFITAVALVRAVRAGFGDRKMQTAKARELMTRFQRDYPDSLRSAAIPVFLDALQ